MGTLHSNLGLNLALLLGSKETLGNLLNLSVLVGEITVLQ